MRADGIAPCAFQTFIFRYSINQVSISPTFYEQLLRSQIPKAQKKTVKSSSFLRFWDLRVWKLLVNTLMKLTPSVNLTNNLWAAFCTKVTRASFLYLWLRFVIFVLRKKLAQKLLLKCWLNWPKHMLRRSFPLLITKWGRGPGVGGTLRLRIIGLKLMRHLAIEKYGCTPHTGIPNLWELRNSIDGHKVSCTP